MTVKVLIVLAIVTFVLGDVSHLNDTSTELPDAIDSETQDKKSDDQTKLDDAVKMVDDQTKTDDQDKADDQGKADDQVKAEANSIKARFGNEIGDGAEEPGYNYQKPNIPFETGNGNVNREEGYNYPKPQNPMTYPTKPSSTEPDFPDATARVKSIDEN